MVNASALEIARENYEFHLRTALEQIGSRAKSPGAYFMAAFSYRVLAICSLLLEADQEAFATMLSKSGNARLAFLKEVANGLKAPPKFLSSSKNIGFIAALAAGDQQAAASIAGLSPKQHYPEVEYEDNFLFFHFLQRLTAPGDNRADLDSALSRWQTVLEGGESGYLAVCKGLFSGDQKEFSNGFDALIETRERELNEYRKTLTRDPDLLASEGKVFVEGLAVLRLAEMRGLTVEADYKLLPRVARIPAGTPLPPVESWRTMG